MTHLGGWMDGNDTTWLIDGGTWNGTGNASDWFNTNTSNTQTRPQQQILPRKSVAGK